LTLPAPCGSVGHLMRKLLFACIVGLTAIAAFAAVAGGGEFPTLPMGGKAMVAGTHVTCDATATTVSCEKAGGLTATLVKAGSVSVTHTPIPSSGAKARQLRVNGGSVLVSQDIYCHVYVAGVPTLTCSLLQADGGAPSTHGFDMSDRSVVLFRYDASASRHDIKTIPQP
jgi:hypothetical protein